MRKGVKDSHSIRRTSLTPTRARDTPPSPAWRSPEARRQSLNNMGVYSVQELHWTLEEVMF